MAFYHRVGNTNYVFPSLVDLLAKASSPRSGDRLAGIAAESAEQNISAKYALADVTLSEILAEPLIAYEDDTIQDERLCRRTAWHRNTHVTCNCFHELDVQQQFFNGVTSFLGYVPFFHTK